MSDKCWMTFMVPGSGAFDAWVDADQLTVGGGFIEVENLTRIDIVVDPRTGQPTGDRVDRIAETAPFNLNLCLFWINSAPEQIDKLFTAWGKIAPVSPAQMKQEAKRRGLAHD